MVDQIPIVDMKNLFSTPFNKEDQDMKDISQEFGKALHEYGFAYLTNHGIPEDLVSIRT